MDELRWILLIVGGVLIAGIYLWGVRGEIADRFRKPVRLPEHHDPDLFSDTDLEPPTTRSEPGLGFGPEAAGDEARSRAPEAQSHAYPRDVVEDDSERMNLVVTIIGRDNAMFPGTELARVATELGLQEGERGTLDCYAEAGGSRRGQPVFSIANVLEPGTFDWKAIDDLKTPGLVCFMRLPGPVDGKTAVELMLSVTQRLAESLDGVLCDDRRLRLSQQGIEHVRSEVTEFERRRQLESLRRGLG